MPPEVLPRVPVVDLDFWGDLRSLRSNQRRNHRDHKWDPLALVVLNSRWKIVGP